MTEYLVPFENGESEFVEKRSRFISHIWRVETEAEARARIEEMKKKYYDARHNCWCCCRCLCCERKKMLLQQPAR